MEILPRKKLKVMKNNTVQNCNEAVLCAHTTFRLEALRYEQELFFDENPITDRSGWKLLIGKDFPDGRVSSSDISSFVDEVYELCKKSDKKLVDFDKAHVCAMLFTKFRCTLDENMLGFILKSKTVVEAEKPEIKTKKRFLLFRFIAWMWRGFKRFYNGVLESLKIG